MYFKALNLYSTFMIYLLLLQSKASNDYHSNCLLFNLNTLFILLLWANSVYEKRFSLSNNIVQSSRIFRLQQNYKRSNNMGLSDTKCSVVCSWTQCGCKLNTVLLKTNAHNSFSHWKKQPTRGAQVRAKRKENPFLIIIRSLFATSTYRRSQAKQSGKINFLITVCMYVCVCVYVAFSQQIYISWLGSVVSVSMYGSVWKLLLCTRIMKQPPQNPSSPSIPYTRSLSCTCLWSLHRKTGGEKKAPKRSA